MESSRKTFKIDSGISELLVLGKQHPLPFPKFHLVYLEIHTHEELFPSMAIGYRNMSVFVIVL